LIKKQLADTGIFNNITEFSISVDAGSQEVYENVRRGGSWPILLENLDYIKSIGKNRLTTLNFAVQKNNFNDLQNFIDMMNLKTKTCARCCFLNTKIFCLKQFLRLFLV
jgi:wyosine [tRNA(Phe)-imidazoG37] synthetase (radical SAM superfamily)